MPNLRAAEPAPISVRKLSKSYDAFRALNDVDLDVAAGEFVTLLGPSGSGKSTLLMAIAGFVRPDRGHVFMAGQDLVRLPANKRNIGVVFQNYALFPHMDVIHNVGFPLRVRNVAGDAIRRRAAAALETVRLSGFETRRVVDLSGGQRQRVALARAMVFEPRVLLMDEPLSALDKNLREDMQIEIRDLHARLGLTVIYVTHDQREALTLADRIAVMDRGEIVQVDAPEAIYRRPSNAFVAGFIGETVLVPMDEIRRSRGGERVPEQGKVAVIRSEDFRLTDEHGPDGSVAFNGRVRAVVYQGDSWLVQAVTETGRILHARVQQPHRAAIEDLTADAPVTFHIDRAKLHILQ